MSKAILVVVCFFVFLFNSVSQDSLSLTQAIEIGLENNYSIRIEKTTAEIDKNNNTWGVAGRYPSINFNIGQNNSRIYRKPTNPFQVGGTNTSDNFTNQLDVQWVLFNGFRVNINKNRLSELEKLSMGNVSVVVENTIQNIILGYNLAVLESRRLDVLAKVLKLSKERYDLVKLRREVGSAITFDVVQEENAYLTDSSNYLSQQLNFKNALRNLNMVINEDLNKTYLLTDSLNVIEAAYSFEDLNQKMISSNNNLRNQFINQSLLKYNTQLNQTSLFPVVTMNLGGNTSNDMLNAQFQRDRPDVYTTNYGYSYGGYINFTLRYNIFNGGQIRKSIQNAKIQERVGELSISQMQQTLSNDLIQLYELFSLRKNLVKLAEANVKAANLNVDLANERYKNGYLSSIDYRIIQINYQNTALSHLEAVYNVIESNTDLLRITGGIINEYQK